MFLPLLLTVHHTSMNSTSPAGFPLVSSPDKIFFGSLDKVTGTTKLVLDDVEDTAKATLMIPLMTFEMAGVGCPSF